MALSLVLRRHKSITPSLRLYQAIIANNFSKDHLFFPRFFERAERRIHGQETNAFDQASFTRRLFFLAISPRNRSQILFSYRNLFRREAVPVLNTGMSKAVIRCLHLRLYRCVGLVMLQMG